MVRRISSISGHIVPHITEGATTTIAAALLAAIARTALLASRRVISVWATARAVATPVIANHLARLILM